MLDHTARTQAWLSDLAAMIAEIDAHGVPTPRRRARRSRKLKPLWEE
jgi:hypothetical protein